MAEGTDRDSATGSRPPALLSEPLGRTAVAPPRVWGEPRSPGTRAHARAAGVNREPCLEHPAAGKDFVPLLVAIALGRDSEEPFNLLTVTAFLLRPVNSGSSWCAHGSRTRF